MDAGQTSAATTALPSQPPSQPTPFIGRDRELGDLAVLLADPACRLLTLTGPGGIGKTRLAIEATRNTGSSAGGVFYVPLQPVASSEFLASAIADGVRCSITSTPRCVVGGHRLENVIRARPSQEVGFRHLRIDHRRDTKMNRRFYLLAALAALVLGMLASSAPAHVVAAQPGDTTSPVTFPFATHITMGLPEQDVSVKHDGAPAEQVFRLGVNDAKDAAVLSQQVYASSSAQGHDPFGMGSNPIGPYPAGEALGFTMGQ